MNKLEEAIIAGTNAARQHVKDNPEGANWYPCGFAWLTYKCRKNAKEAAILLQAGFRWDDYSKLYTFSGGSFSNTQSMNYKTEILRAFTAASNPILLAAGINGFGIHDRID